LQHTVVADRAARGPCSICCRVSESTSQPVCQKSRPVNQRMDACCRCLFTATLPSRLSSDKNNSQLRITLQLKRNVVVSLSCRRS